MYAEIALIDFFSKHSARKVRASCSFSSHKLLNPRFSQMSYAVAADAKESKARSY